MATDRKYSNYLNLSEEDRREIDAAHKQSMAMTDADRGKDISNPTQEKRAFLQTVNLLIFLIETIGKREFSISKLNEIERRRPDNLVSQEFIISSETLEKFKKPFFVSLAQEIEVKINELPAEVRNHSKVRARVNSMLEQLDLIK